MLACVTQWNPGLAICQGSVKIVSLNRDIVIAEFPVMIDHQVNYNCNIQSILQ